MTLITKNYISKFQFHKGTIRTLCNLLIINSLTYFNSIKVRLEHQKRYDRELSALFQFHKGTIRTMGRPSLFRGFRNFNSIKVRLELESNGVVLQYQ